MYSDHYFVDREAGTYSDSLAAFGLGYLLSRVLVDAGVSPQVTVKDYGTTYLVQLGTPLTLEMLAHATYPDELLPFIQNEAHSEGAKHYPLGEYFAILKSRTSSAADQSDTEQTVQHELPADFNVMGLVAQLQAIKQGDNSTGVWDRIAQRLWMHLHHQPQQYRELLKLVLSVYCETPNRMENGLADFRTWRKNNKIETDLFKDKDKLVAVFNPSWQQSTNSAKPEGPKEIGHLGFWLPEWLKMIGMPRCALVVSMRSKKKSIEEDKKVYVLAPASVDLQSHDSIMKAFRGSIFRTTSIKADIEVLLKYVEAFLMYLERPQQRRGFRKVRDSVDGFYCAYFKKSSKQISALSLTNLPFLQLPAWVRFQDVPTEGEIALYQGIVQHQRDVLFYRCSENGKWEDFVDENTSEGNSLLRQYREFLSGGSLTALLDFYAGFGALIMQQASQKKSFRQFETSQIRRLLETMTPTLQGTLDNEGFREVARAIRLCTVTAQRLKSKKIKTQHEIRYGLAQELKRKAPFKSEFTTAIMEFINQYQAENARARERGKSNIHEVTTTDVRNLSALIDACPGDSAEPVASLLLAFGYAYDDDPKEEEFATDETADNTQGATQ